MSPKLVHKLFPIFSAFFALSLMLSACGGGGEVDAVEGDDAGLETEAEGEGEVETEGE